MKLENLKNLESLLVGLSALDLKTSTEIKIDNCLKDIKEAIAVNGCSVQLKDEDNDIIGNITSVGFTTPSNHGVLKIELPYSYYKIEKLSKGDKLKLLIV